MSESDIRAATYLVIAQHFATPALVRAALLETDQNLLEQVIHAIPDIGLATQQAVRILIGIVDEERLGRSKD